MKRNLLASALLITSLPAATVVSDTFTGPAGTSLIGTAPDAGPASTNWVGNSGFKFATGGGVTNTNVTSVNGNAIMASVDLGLNYFTNNLGVHTITMNVTTTATDTDVIGIGFGTAQGTNLNASYANANTYGSPWMFLRANGNSEVRSNATTLGGPVNFGATTATRTMQLILDNSASVWTVSASINGTFIDLNGAAAGTAYSYITNPTSIRNVGITFTETDSFGRASNFVYDFVAVPEPSAALLGMVSLAGLVLRRKR